MFTRPFKQRPRRDPAETHFSETETRSRETLGVSSVLKTLNYCLTALEQLEGWAVFAIFPTDEIHKGDR